MNKNKIDEIIETLKLVKDEPTDITYAVKALEKQKELIDYLEWLQEYGENIDISDVAYKIRNLIIGD